MRCPLCGAGIWTQALYCARCTTFLNHWAAWAKEQWGETDRWPKVTITFGHNGATVMVDRSGGHPDPNKFIESPPAALPNPDWVHIQVPHHGEGGLAHQDVADLAFYLRLKATPGCTSKFDRYADMMNLYIDPNSAAALLFVQRMMRKRGLPDVNPTKKGLLIAARLLPEPAKLLTEDDDEMQKHDF